MDDRIVSIDSLLNKLTVLDNRIQKLESLTQEVMDEIEFTYQQQIKDLYLKKEAAQQKLKDIQGLSD